MLEANSVACRHCDRAFSIRDGVPLFVQLEDEAPPNTERDFSHRYQRHYQHADAARAYDESFKDSFHKRHRTGRERQILHNLLASQQRSQIVLDLPCGGGRLSSPIAAHTDLLIEADISAAQLALVQAEALPVRRAYMTASATNIPLTDRSVDGLVCARLSHHLPSAQERRELIRELARVARRFIIVSFTDRRSLLNWSRRLRGRKPNPCHMDIQEMQGIAEDLGLRMLDCPSVSLLGSRHRYALLVRVTD